MTELTLIRARRSRNAGVLFLGAAFTMAIECGAMIASGWFARAVTDRQELLFWGAGIIEVVMVAMFAGAAIPGGLNDVRQVRRITALTLLGVGLFIAAPALCVTAIMVNSHP